MGQKRLDEAQQEIYDLLTAFGIDLESVTLNSEFLRIEVFHEDGARVFTITWPDIEARDILISDKKGLALFVTGSMLTAVLRP